MKSRLTTVIIVIAVTVLGVSVAQDKSYAATDIQQLNGLLGTDTSYFPIAVWWQSPSNFQAYANIGINLDNNGDDTVNNSFMQSAQAAAMGIIQTDQTSGLASSYKSSIQAWGQVDEPDNAQSNGSGGYDPCISPSTIVSKYNSLKAADSTRPVVLNFGQGAAYTTWGGRGTCSGNTAMYAQYAAGADIVSFDIYPINSGYPLTYIADGVDNLRQWTNDTKPVWAYIETTKIGSGNGTPTPAQIRAETWLALTHGARGIQYFAHILSPTFNEAGLLSAGTAPGIGTTNQQIKRLAPQLNSPTITNGVTVSSSLRIDKTVKKTGTDAYVFAVTPGTTTGNATFTVPGAGSGTVTVIDENRTLALSNDSFTDSFGAYGVHLYKISMATGTGEAKPGDFNNDGNINVYDLSILASVWNTAATAEDLNHDGVVNQLDATAFSGLYGS